MQGTTIPCNTYTCIPRGWKIFPVSIGIRFHFQEALEKGYMCVHVQVYIHVVCKAACQKRFSVE